MEKKNLRVKITIADRVYPMTIESRQEEGLRRAAKKIEEVIKQFEKSYAVRDKQDVLAMCALQFAAMAEQQIIENQYQDDELKKKLQFIEDRLAMELE